MQSFYVTQKIKMSDTRPLILISNDDGFDAKGINDLAEMVRDLGDVVIVAPDGGRSGAAVSITSGMPVRLKKISSEPGLEVYSCTGSPCDCVKIALDSVLDRQPDIVLAGINHGDNASINVLYSGTMGCVIEGMIKHVPSVGFSSCKREPNADFSALKPYVRKIVKNVLSLGLPPHLCLNVNFPPCEEFKGVRVCRMDEGEWVNEWERRIDPRNREYFWLTGTYKAYTPDDDSTDRWALNHEYVAITPIQLDMTAYKAFDQIQELIK